MESHEQAIRSVQRKWFEATTSGDIDALSSLMTEDVVFLTPGRPSFGRDVFCANFSAGNDHVQIQCAGVMEEILLAGDTAITRSYLRVSVISRSGGETRMRSGYTMTVFQQQSDG